MPLMYGRNFWRSFRTSVLNRAWNWQKLGLNYGFLRPKNSAPFLTVLEGLLTASEETMQKY